MSKAIETIKKAPLREIITEADSYPYTSTRKLTGLSVLPTGSVDVVLTINTDPAIEITIPTDTTFEDDFDVFNQINVTAGDSYFISLRGF